MSTSSTPATPTYEVRFLGSAGSIDWTRANLLAEFDFPWEDREAPETTFRALWSDTALHFRFDCVDDDLVLAEGADDREKVIGSDRVEIFLTPDLSLSPYYCLEMDPRGALLDYRGRFHREFDWSWSCPGLELDQEIEGNRYSVEGTLPLETLRALSVLAPGSREMHAGIYRAEFSTNPDGSTNHGWIAWVDPGTPRPDFHVPASFGRLRLVDG